jgi:pimeloyl-ACP methyl ester carboxylesterase
MHPRLAAQGIRLVAPTYTGLGERSHLAHEGIDLSHHVTDVVQVLDYERLDDVVLLGHSYGGMVATGVADRVPERIRQVIYLDAFVPADGESLLDLLPAEAAAGTRAAAMSPHGEGWRVPPNPPPPDTSDADLAWITPRRRPQPLRTFTEQLRLAPPARPLPRSYIYCTRTGPGDVFGRFAAAAREGSDWVYREIDASHSPHITAPDALTALLVELVLP